MKVVFIFQLFMFLYHHTNSDHTYSVIQILSQRNTLTRDQIGRSFRELAIKKNISCTAVIINYARPENLPSILHSLSDSGIFEEIIIWNASPRKLDLSSVDSNVPISIVNGENLGTITRYMACEMATTSACYTQDDDWDPSTYIYSLYSSFLQDSRFVHAVTNRHTYYEYNRKMEYIDSSIGLHARHVWLGCGAFFLRESALRHIELSKKYLTPSIAPKIPECGDKPLSHANDPLFHSDVAFSVFQNVFPVDLITTSLTSAGVDRDPIGGGKCPDMYLDILSKTIAEIVASELQNTSLGIFNREYYESAYYTKAVCRKWYPCTLSANLTRIFGDDFQFAIDNDKWTAWNTQSLYAGDWFSLYSPVKIFKHVSITFQHSKRLQESLDVFVSHDGNNWINHTTAPTCTYGNINICVYYLKAECRSIRFIFSPLSFIEETLSVNEIDVF